MSCKGFCDFIKGIDMFGKMPEFYFKGKTKKTTWIGRIFTIIFMGLYLAFFIYKLVQMLKRVDVTFYDTFAFTGETPSIKLSSDNFYGGFGIMNPYTEDTFVDESYYYAKATFWSGKKVNGKWQWEGKDIPLEKCKLEKFGEKYRDMFKDKNLDNLYCLSNVDVTLEGYATSEAYSYFDVQLFPCVNKTGCVPQEILQQLLTKNTFQFKMQDIEMTPQDFKNPAQPREKDISGPIYLELFQQIYAYLQITMVETDEDIVGFGLSNVKTEKFLKYDESWIISAPADPKILIEEGKPLCQITVQLSEKVLTQKRKYMTLIEVLGDVGGLMEVLLSFFNIICSFSTDILYEKSIVNNLFEFDINKKVVLLKAEKDVENIYFKDKKPRVYLIRQRTLATQKSDENTIQNSNNKYEDELNNNKMNNDIVLEGRGGIESTNRRYRYKLRSSFSTNLGKYDSSERKFKNATKNNNINYRNIFNTQEYKDQNTMEKGSVKQSSTISEIKFNKFKIYFCFLCIRKTKNVQNILLDEGMNIVNEKLDILNLFRKIYKDDMTSEKFTKIEIKKMSDKCNQNLESLYSSSNFKSY